MLSLMDVFLARQPIFDARKKVFAYEILYRNSLINSFSHTNADAASANVIINAFVTFGIENLTGNKPAFINFTENLINLEIATIIPKESVVIEVLETVEANQTTIETCRRLKSMGYALALDDFVYKPEYEPLIALADIIKIDFTISSRREIEQLMNKAKNYPITFLAEKVETYEEFNAAKELGFSLFQGYFFSKPEVLTSKQITPVQASYLQLIGAISQTGIDFNKLEAVIAKDLSLVYSLLRLINSAAFGIKQKIVSVKHALIMLGESELRKWMALLALQNLSRNKPDELIRLSLIRAKFAEVLAEKTPCKGKPEVLYLAGLFSLLDVILDKPLADILTELHAADGLRNCLLNPGDSTGEVLRLIIAYEQGRWDAVTACADKLAIGYAPIVDAYKQALLWYNELATES